MWSRVSTHTRAHDYHGLTQTALSQGRLEAYLPENKVYSFRRPNLEEWQDRSVPPPESSIHEEVFDCSDVKDVHGIDTDMPTHGGYHYSSTAVEWYHLIQTMDRFRHTGQWRPQVSLTDGIRAVELGLSATKALGTERIETHTYFGMVDHFHF